MKAWYSKVRDTELKDGGVRATYVVTFETDNVELKREIEKYLQGIMDKTENSSEKPNNCEVKNYCDDCLYTDTCDSKEFFYACTSKATISKMEQVDKDINVRSKDELKTCEWCKFYDGENCYSQEPCKVMLYFKTEPQTERSE